MLAWFLLLLLPSAAADNSCAPPEAVAPRRRIELSLHERLQFFHSTITTLASGWCGIVCNVACEVRAKISAKICVSRRGKGGQEGVP